MEGPATSTTGGSASANSSTIGTTTSTGSVTSNIPSMSSDAIIQRLVKCGVPPEYLERGQAGVVVYVKEHRAQLQAVIAALLPGVDEVPPGTAEGADETTQRSGLRKEFQNQCRDALKWVQWAMFEGEPQAVLADARQQNGGTRGVCGAVWGSNDIAYRCRTCEHDPTCAICVPCFQHGNHATHDYSMIRTGGGCCDCGDITAWKQSGFCSRHCGPGQVASLTPSVVAIATPVLQALLSCWESRLVAADLVADGKPKKWSLQTKEEKVASQLSVACIDMLLEFCNCSESMLAFTADVVGKKSASILDILMRTEYFLPKAVVTSLHELLYKLLGDSNFKHTFAQIFISHYPKFLRDSVAEETAAAPGGAPNSKNREQAILGSFSVQIFTVPTLTPKLVTESRLLDMLLETLKEFFCSCVGDDGRLMVSKAPIANRLYFRVLEDIRYVMSHLEVAQHVAQDRLDLARAWLHLLAFVQGMYPQRRITNMHVEEESEEWGSAYLLEVQMAPIHPLFVAGAAASGNAEVSIDKIPEHKSQNDLGTAGCEKSNCDLDASKPAKVGCSDGEAAAAVACSSSSGRTESDVEMYDATSLVGVSCCPSEVNVKVGDGRKATEGSTTGMTMSGPLMWLISECTQVLATWLALDSSREIAKSGQVGIDIGQGSGLRRGVQWRGRGWDRGMNQNVVEPPPAAPAAAGEGEGGVTQGRGRTIREWLRRGRHFAVLEPRVLSEVVQERSVPVTTASTNQAADMDVDVLHPGVGKGVLAGEKVRPEWWMGVDVDVSGAGFGQLFEDDEWPVIDFDVSRQEVSYHIPLHRMLGLLLHKVLERYSAQSAGLLVRGEGLSAADSGVLQGSRRLLAELFPARFQVPGFAAALMEHPLRLQVLCAQVQAGMWRRNGHSTSGLCDLYHTVHWCEDSLELDLFLLQCCSVMAPPEEFVERIQTRFGLTAYFDLTLSSPNEYEPILAEEFLALLIRLVSERGFCGLTTVEALRRELVQRLAVGDATHSSLLKALPPRLQDNKHVQECLDAVAAFRSPSGMQQGKYVLREECWQELDLYHPRWSPRELQSAEERYLQACNAPAVFVQLPRWKQPFVQLQAMGQFVISGRVHDILRSVFFHATYAENLSNSRASEGMLFTALHLLALALDVCAAAAQNKVGPSCPVVESTESGASSSGLTSSNLRSSSPLLKSGNFIGVQERPPLLVHAVERVFVRWADDTMMLERQSLLSLLVLLLRKFSTGNASRLTVGEAGRYNVADLIRSLLVRFTQLSRECMYEIESLAPDIIHRLSGSGTSRASASGNIETKDEASVIDMEKRRVIARERQAAVMAKMKAAQEKFIANYQPTEESSGQGKGDEAEAKRPKDSGIVNDVMSEDSHATACSLCRDSTSASPICFLILVQKSKLLDIAEKATPSWQRSSVPAFMEREDEAPGTSTAAGTGAEGPSRDMHTTAELLHWIQDALGNAQTRARLLEGEDLLELIRNGLPPGIRNTVGLVPEAATADVGAVGHPADTESEEVESSSEITEAENSSETRTAEVGSIVNWWEDNHGEWEQEENSTSRGSAVASVLAEYVTAVSRIPLEVQRQVGGESNRQGDTEPGRGEARTARIRRIPARTSQSITESTMLHMNGMSDSVGVYLSACGHAVHQECLDRYFSSLLQRYYSRALFEGVQIVDPDMGEFLCPVCRRLANSILPVLPGHTGLNILFKPPSIPQLSGASTTGDAGCLQLEHGLRLLIKAEELVSKPGFRKVVDPQLPDSVKGVLEALAMRLCGLFYPKQDHFSSFFHGRVPQGLLLWDVFRYSLMSAELAARSHKVGLGIASGLVALGEVGDATRGSVLPLLLHVAKATQSQSRQAVLLRARGMQLLVDSIVHGISTDMCAEKPLHGNFSSLLQYLEKSQDSADVQFWKRLADPVLIHDPFCSFIWLLFCLPLPFPANGAPFTALVHLFYLVCVTQIIAQAGTSLISDAELAPSSRSFMTAVNAAVAGTVVAQYSLDENAAAIPVGPPLVVIRRLTLVFLRRCSLLQNLMSGSTQVLPVARAHSWEIPEGHVNLLGASSSASDVCDSESQILLEMEELEQLERAFSIPPLPDLLEQHSVHDLVLSWCQHVKTDAGMHLPRQSPHLTTAAPFQMMQLPNLFQDLLQRYVKERCPRCNTVPERPALCLLCGSLCCAVSQRLCCSINGQGECYRHAMTCGAGIGIFLMLKRTTILLQRCERQAMWPSPYLDAYGEEDIDLRRGKPLFLCQERYASLTAMVASHGLDYSSPVLSHTTRDTVF